MTDYLSMLIDFVRDLDPVLRTLLAGIGMLLETSVFIGLIVPGDTIALVAATGVQGHVQFFWLVVALMFGSLIGESIGFFLGRWIGPKLRHSRLGKRLGERNWQAADRYLGERGGVAVFLSRFLPVLHSLIPLTAGMAGMRYRVFLAWTSAASIIWAVILVSIGAGAAAGYDRLAGQIKGAGYIVAGIVAVLLVILWLLKRAFLRKEHHRLHGGNQEIDEPAL